MPRFSIVVPSYNNADFLAECLESIRNQHTHDWETIVVDDASTDNSLTVAHQLADIDSRISIVAKSLNEGLHLARKTGVAATTGDYILFLDSDDTLAPDTLTRLDRVLVDTDADIVHFGLVCIARNGMTDSAATSFEQWSNADSTDLHRSELLASIYTTSQEYGRDWHVTHRLFRGSLCREAFSLMTDSRLERAEDSYELLVLASRSRQEVSATNIRGYLYNIGRGVTNAAMLSAAQFIRSAQQMRACCAATEEYARGTDDSLVQRCAMHLRRRLVFSLMNEWYEKVPASNKRETALSATKCFTGSEIAVELMRFARDEAYHRLEHPITGKEPLFDWFDLAEQLFDHAQSDHPLSKRYKGLKEAASQHIADLRGNTALRATYDAQRIRIFVSTHKDADRFKSAILQPVHVGASTSSTKLPYCLRDDDGDNISEKNPMYCELTAQYWAWKNISADYYGFCHYRRYFDFSEQHHQENDFGEVMDTYINPAAAQRYAIDDETISHVVSQYDVITTPFGDLNEIIDQHSTPTALWNATPTLHDEDLRRCYEILCELHPEYEHDAQTFLNGTRSCFCNMFIMKRQIFFDYCTWLFPILKRFEQLTDMSKYSKETLRTPGHLSERLLNIYLIHHKRIGTPWTMGQLQCIHFTNPEPDHGLQPLGVDDAEHVVPVVLAADDNYVPQLTTTIHSVMSNASKRRFYDVIVLQRNISWDNQERLRHFFGQFPNMQLRFSNVARMIDGYNLTTNNEHISVETYYRFLIQELLPFYDKVLYLDSDLVVNGDIAELYDTELEDHLLGAIRDIDFLGNLNVKHGKRMDYATHTLGMKDPYSYFQAGVLVLNTAAMRKKHTIQQWLEYATNPDFIYNDQDVLNAHCEGDVAYLPWEWNVVHDCAGRVANLFSQAPNDIYDAYMESRRNPRIIHYAGFQKPWADPECDFAPQYWHYARQTPFYEHLLKHMASLSASARDDTHQQPPRTIRIDNPLRKIADPFLPIGSRRRTAAKNIVRIFTRRH